MLTPRDPEVQRIAKQMKSPFISIGELLRLIKEDPTARSLLVSNVVMILLALIEGWGLKTVMFIYWGQNIIIGFFNFLKILNAGPIRVRGVSSARVPRQAQLFIAIFFVVHYGFFHFGYWQFLQPLTEVDWNWVGLSLLLFLSHHGFSFQYNYGREKERWGVEKLMFFPYLRIIPMHMTIIFGGFFLAVLNNELADRIVLLFFLLLKTQIDLRMHQVEHAFSEGSE